MKKLTILLVAALAVFTSCERDPYTGQNTAKVVAAFDVVVQHPHKIVLKNRSVNATSYAWDFGDNSGISVNKNPTYKYLSKGVYKIRLKAFNGSKVDEAEATVTITDPTKCYINGITYQNVKNQNKYYKCTIKDHDVFFVDTWISTDYVLLSSANLPYYQKLAAPVLDPNETSDYYNVCVYWAVKTSASGEQIMKQPLYLSDVYTYYPDSLGFVENNTKVHIHFYWK